MPAKKKSAAKAAKKTTRNPAGKTTKKVAAKKSAGKIAKKTVKKTAAKKGAGKVAAATSAKKGKTSDKSEVVAKKAVKTRKKRITPEEAEKKKEVSRRVSEAVRKRMAKKDKDSSRKATPATFTLDDVRVYLKKRAKDPEAKKKAKPAEKPVTAKVETPKPVAASAPIRSKQSFGAVSVADILGFDPTRPDSQPPEYSSEKNIPEKLLPYYRMLVDLHKEVSDGLHRHSEETLRRSSKEDSGDLSSYGQHMADAGTDSFERDFALSMVSNEQDALYEIDEAIRRIRNGTYGICEITGKPISKQRLKAVPFARYSVEGQIEVEKGRRKVVQRPGIVGIGADDAPMLTDDDGDE